MPQDIPSPVKTPALRIWAFLLAINPWLYSLLTCLLLTVLFSLHLINDSDLGLHLKGGQWILENGRFPSIDTYTYTFAGHGYLDIHWLYQVVLYGIYGVGGYALITLFHALLVAITGFLAFKRLRLVGAPLWLCAFLSLTAVLACEIRFRVRPEILSWVLLSLTLWVLELRAARKEDLLFLLPFLQLIWVNVEGLFILGWGLMGIYSVSGFFAPNGPDRKLLRFSLLAAAVCALNPHFLEGMAYPLSNWRTLTDPLIHDSDKELQSPWLATATLLSTPTLYLFLYKLYCFLLFGLMAATFRNRSLRDWLLALIFFALSASAFRNIPVFMIVSLPLMAAAWGDLDGRWLKEVLESLASKSAAAWIFTFFVLGLCLRVITGAYYVSDRRTDRFGLGLDPLSQPARGCEFLVENHLDGKILNQLDDGGWLDWKGPQKTFIDGRFEVFHGDFYSGYLGAAIPGGLGALADKYQADILFLSPLNSQWIAQLQALPNWRLVYLDPCAVIYLRKGYGDAIPALDFSRVLSNAGVSKSIISESPSLLDMPPPSAWACFWEDLGKPAAFPDDLSRLGIFCATSGHPGESEAFFLEAIRRSQGRYYDFYYNLGLLYGQEGRNREGNLCLSQVLRRDPPADLARQISGP